MLHKNFNEFWLWDDFISTMFTLSHNFACKSLRYWLVLKLYFIYVSTSYIVPVRNKIIPQSKFVKKCYFVLPLVCKSSIIYTHLFDTLASFLRKIGRFLICTLDKGQCKAEVNFLGIFGICGNSGQSLSLTYLSM